MFDWKPRSEPMLALLVAGSLLPAAAARADGSLPTEHDYYADMPVVLSATRLEQDLTDSPLPVTIIDREMIEASGARDIEEVLRLAPGMIVGYHDGHTGFATYHAIADRYARRMQILIDGRSVFTPTFGGVDWSSLPLAIEDIERIEIIRAPNAATHGANALLGTISIITRNPAPGSASNLTLEGGSNDIYKVYAHHERDTGRLAWQLSASRWGDAGFEQPPGYADDRDISLLNARLLYHPTPDSQLELRAGAGREDALTSQPQDLISEPPHEEITRRQHQQLNYSRLFDSGELKVQLYRTAEQQQEAFFSRPVPELGGITVFRDRSIESRRHDLEISYSQIPLNGLRTVWGAALRLDEVYSPSYFSTDEWLDYMRYQVFGQGEWRINGEWLINAGLMAEHSDLSGQDVSPHLALNYKLSEAHAFRLSFARAVRTPVLIEDRADQRFQVGPIFNQEFATSGGLDSEKIHAIDVGYLGHMLDNALFIDARLFHDRISELITYYLVPYPGDGVNGAAFDFRNFDELEITGAETQIQYRPSDVTRLVFNYAYVHLDSTDRDERYSRTGPRHNVSLLAIRDFGPGLTGSLGFYYMSDYDGVDTGGHIPVTRRLDLRLAGPFELAGARAEWALTVQGVLGGYHDFRPINEFDTRAYLRMRLWF